MTDYSMLNLLKMKLVFVFSRLLVLFFIFFFKFSKLISGLSEP